MKSPLSKLRGLAFNRSEPKKEHHRKAAKLDDLVQATQDMQDMKKCYDSIMSVVNFTANNAYEFSVSMEELGTCLLEKIELNDDEDSGQALMMMGRAQLELQKIFNAYRSHILQTMAKPSASLLRELEIVEEMKRQCDDKREVYKTMLTAYRTKGRPFRAKSRVFSSKELQEAQADYEGEAAQFVFRLKALKQGQFRSLLTQTARHHAAQLSFFRKGLKTLETVEPHIQAVTEKQHIDYQFKELDDDNDTGSEYVYDEYDDDWESSFGHQHTKQDQDVMSISRNSLEETTDKSQPDLHIFGGRSRPGSQSAPIYFEEKLYRSDILKVSHPLAARKFYSFPLPAPPDKNTVPTSPNKGGQSSPLDAKGATNDPSEAHLCIPAKSPERSLILRENIAMSGPINISYFPKVPAKPQYSLAAFSDSKICTRHAFSGPIISKPFSVNCKSPAVPPKTSTPKICQLHELPRPPIGSGETEKPRGLVGHSAPLIAGVQVATTGKTSVAGSGKSSQATWGRIRVHNRIALPLPIPPGPTACSFSDGQRTPKYTTAKLLDATNTKVV